MFRLMTVVVAAALTLTGAGTAATAAPGPVAPAAPRVSSPYAPRPWTNAQLVSIARETCASLRPAIKGVNCRRVAVKVTRLKNATAQAPFTYRLSGWTKAGDPIWGIRSGGVLVDPSARQYSRATLKYVFTHEFNHIRQYTAVKTEDGWNTLVARANRHFQPVAKVRLTGYAGVEILTDCMTVYRDKAYAPPGIQYPYFTQYGKRSAPSYVCRKGWDRLLPH